MSDKGHMAPCVRPKATKQPEKESAVHDRRSCLDRATQKVLLAGLLAVMAAGCGYPPDLADTHRIGRPRARVGRYPTATIGGGDAFIEPNKLGHHDYYFPFDEKTGVVYTCRGGHIDLSHVRKSADWTAYAAEEIFAAIQKRHTQLELVLSDPGHYHITLNYPCDWDSRSTEEQLHSAREASIALGQYLSYLCSVWHEIITWFGYRNLGIYPEFPSSFSWEDTYSDLLGTYIAAAALHDTAYSYDDAVTLLLNQEIQVLGARSAATAKEAARQVENHWYKPGIFFLVDITKRNLDIGLDDGAITPWIVPDVDACPDAEARSYAVPTLQPLFDLGFWVKVEIEPKGFEQGRLLHAAYPHLDTPPSRIVPAVHFHPIMAKIRKEAVALYGPDVDVPWPDSNTAAGPVPSTDR